MRGAELAEGVLQLRLCGVKTLYSFFLFVTRLPALVPLESDSLFLVSLNRCLHLPPNHQFFLSFITNSHLKGQRKKEEKRKNRKEKLLVLMRATSLFSLALVLIVRDVCPCPIYHQQAQRR